jgi:hypothetical protein
MGIFDEFFAGAKEVIKAGPKINADARSQMISILGSLGDDLETALDITIVYLRGGTRVSDPAALSKHLSQAGAKLGGYFKEFKVCNGLYGLRDEFKQIFNPKKYALSLASFRSIPALVNDLTSGERSILDDLSGLMGELASLANDLDAVAGKPRRDKAQVKSVHEKLKQKMTELEHRRKDVKKAVRELIDNL